MEAIRSLITHPVVMGTWLVSMIVSLGLLLWDLRTHNRAIRGLMRWVWILTVVYSGPVGLAIYAWSGRAQITTDSLWRRAFRSVAHCYSGCGAGEITGILLTVGVLSAPTVAVAGTTFGLAYAFGFALTMGPLIQDGVPPRTAFRDAAYSESASIAVMEIVAIGVDLWLAGDATIGQPLFWSSLVVSLSLGLAAAYPVNVWLIRAGVKEGMADPREMATA